MVQANVDQNSSGNDYIKPAKQTLLQKFDIPLHHLEFKYVETCQDGNELEKILQILQSGEEGYFPDLLQSTKNQLSIVKPKSKYLRVQTPVLTKYDISKDEWSSLSSDIQDWVDNISKNDQELHDFQNLKIDTNLPPLRQTDEFKKETGPKKPERIKSMDYNSWDKLDVDTELLKMELEEEKQIAEANKLQEEKEKLNTIKIKPSVMTKAELLFSANREKERGNEFFSAGDYEDALYCYTNSLTFLPLAAAYNNRAITNIKLKNYTDAVKDCDEVLKMEPRNEKAYLRKAQACKGLKNYTQAHVYLEKLIKINPNNTSAQNMMQSIADKVITAIKSKPVRMTITEVKQSDPDENNLVEVVLPIPGTSKDYGPYYKTLKVPPRCIEKLKKINKKSLHDSDQHVIDLNKVQQRNKINKLNDLSNKSDFSSSEEDSELEIHNLQAPKI